MYTDICQELFPTFLVTISKCREIRINVALSTNCNLPVDLLI